MQTFVRFGGSTSMNDLVGKALALNGRVGPLTLRFENQSRPAGASILQHSETTANTVTIAIKESSGAGWSQIVAPFNLVPGGTKVVSLNSYAAEVGFFASGNAMVSCEIPDFGAATMRRGHIDLQVNGRKGFTFDAGVNRNPEFPAP